MKFEDRLSVLSRPHVHPLTEFRKTLLSKLQADAFVPNFDPLDGGVDAKTLLLLETPGRVPRKTQFTSIDNPSATSRNLTLLLAEAKLERASLIMWNLVPWDIGLSKKVQATRSEHHSTGTEFLLQLLQKLTQLKTVVFFGTAAQTAIPVVNLANPRLLLLPCPHPSPTNLNTRPTARGEILYALKQAAGAQR